MQSGPRLVFEFSGSPTIIDFDFCTIKSIIFFDIFLSTITLLPATQDCPEAPKFPAIIPFAALSRSASSKIIMGDFPPSSRLVAAKLFEEFCIIFLAVSVPPVKAILSISGCEVKGAEQFSASPVTIETTPFGKPASWINFDNSNIAHGAISDAFIITLHPAASAGANFVAVRNI